VLPAAKCFDESAIATGDYWGESSLEDLPGVTVDDQSPYGGGYVLLSLTMLSCGLPLIVGFFGTIISRIDFLQVLFLFTNSFRFNANRTHRPKNFFQHLSEHIPVISCSR
jgi:hypothetical protein